MTPSRVQIPLVVQTVKEIETGEKTKVRVVVPVKEANVEIKRRDASPVLVYESEGGAEISNKLKTDANGQIKAWVGEGPWIITAEGGTPSIALTTYTFDVLTGRGVEHIAGEAVTEADLLAALRSAFVPIGAVINYGGEAGSPPTGFFTCDGSEKEQAAYPILYGKLKTRYGSALAGKFRIPKGEIENTEKQKFVQIIRHD